MNAALEEAAAVDPAWAKKEGRRRAILGLLTAGVLVALAVGVPALVIGFHNGTEITQIQHSACQVEPAGADCQKAKVESSRAANLRTTCIPFFKAGYPCPKPGSTAAERQARRQSLRASSASAPTSGGDATSSPSTGHSQPAPGDGGQGSTGVDGDGGAVNESPEKSTHPPKVPGEQGSGAEGVSPPSSSPSESSTSTSSSQTTERVESTVEKAAPEAAAPVGKAVVGVVEEVGSTVTGTVEGVEATTCGLAKVLC